MTDWITFWIAIWGAVLSTLLVIYKIFFEDKRKVMTKLEAGFIYDTLPVGITSKGGRTTAFGGEQKTIYTLSVNFYNKRKRTINITNYGIWLPDGNHIPTFSLAESANHRLPHSYSDGEGDTFIGDRTKIESSIRDKGLTGTIKIRGYVDDISGKRHFSRKRKITLS